MTRNKKRGFINFCFPISFTILTFLLGWPQIILYEFGYKSSTKIFDANFIVIGVVSNLLILFIIGLVIDKWRKTKGYLSKKYFFKLPILLLIVSTLLFIISLIDKTCT
ncbi:MAG: hypothetical protein AAB861_02725 [Patescibacteria group bacterium]